MKMKESKEIKRVEKKKNNKGITLIAFVITIIVLLILAAVSIATLTGENGILTKAQNAEVQNAKSQAEEEVKLAVGTLQIENNQEEMNQEEKRKLLEDELKKQQEDTTVAIDGIGFLAKHRGYTFEIDEKWNVSEAFNAEEWDKNATPEDVFIWRSDDPNDEGYGVVIGYTANLQNNYTTLKFPSRCTKIEFSDDLNYNGINTADSRAFTYNIVEIEIPGTTKEIGQSAFGDAMTKSFKELKKVVISKGVEKIGDWAFSYTNLSNIIIPDSVTSIGEYAFYNCANLASVTISDSITSIGEYAFSNCTSLTSITIPDSVTNIGTRAFGSVPHIYYNGTATGSPWGARAMN